MSTQDILLKAKNDGIKVSGISFDTRTLKKNNIFFAIPGSNEDGLRYIMLLFQELNLQQDKTQITFWGNIDANSKFISLLKKYVRNISFGKRPSSMTFGFEFDDVPEHQFFDLFNVPLI